jgi:hypothetical protein
MSDILSALAAIAPGLALVVLIVVLAGLCKLGDYIRK